MHSFWPQLKLIIKGFKFHYYFKRLFCKEKKVKKYMFGYVAITAIGTMGAYFNYSQKVCNPKQENKNWGWSKKELKLMLSLFVSISERSSRFQSWKRIHTRRMPFCTVPLESPSTWLVSPTPLISKPLMK